MAKRIVGGTSVSEQFSIKRTVPSQRAQVESLSYGMSPYTRWDFMDDFDGVVPTMDVEAPLIKTTGNADTNVTPVTNGGVSRAYIRAPHGGVITAVTFYAEDGFTQSGTDYLTFTGLNLLAAGTGSAAVLDTTAHVNTLDSNAAAINGGTNLTAKVPYALTLSGTAANLAVASGDLLEFTATGTGTPAGMDAAKIRVRFAFASDKTRVAMTRTAGSPVAQRVANTAAGEGLVQLSATNEVQDCFFTWIDQLQVNMAGRFYFEAMVKMGTVTTAQTVVVGLCSAFNTTLSSTTYNAWFRFNASLAPLLEVDDNTNDTDAQAALTPALITANTYYLFTIDGTDKTAIKFFINDQYCGSITGAAFTSSSLCQPIIGIKKASGTGTVGVTCDYYRVLADRW